MASYDELRARVIAEYIASWAPSAERVARMRNAPPVVPSSEKLMQGAYAHAWAQHQQRAVCNGTAELPDTGLDSSPLVFSKTHTAIPNIGGLISESMDGYPVTEDAEKAPARAPWVLVQMDGQYVALTLDQAFRRALREAVWPEVIGGAA